MTWMEIIALSAAVAFIILVGFAVWTLIAAKRTLSKLGDAVDQMKHSVANTAEQSDQLIMQVGRLTNDVHTQVQTLQSCFHSIDQAGAAIGDVASALRKASSVMNQSIHGAEKVIHTHQKRLQDAIEWATTGMELWHRWQAHRNAKSDD
ncbi:DUF948 domain-containing protein [Paenibacillus sedimenti]|uniref:DUF948 domain-containing protein n=1 Tax=Paenibacillus sedimenti TaxID=2770274 RepID=A0A926QK76_9BACL|nr:DUF948 domain-containing protein [Paenibacillus sedimenti]MBD0381192.1 DUF948 domain-containing protein [Paenibacillus sedimenti]